MTHLFDILLAGNQGCPSLLVLTEHVNATYFISFDLPGRLLHDAGALNMAVLSQSSVGKHFSGRNFNAQFEEMLEAFSPTHVVFTRYGLPYGPELMHRFKRAGIPVIYHIDDDLLSLPESLGSDILKRQGDASVMQARTAMLANADLVYASTTPLNACLRGRFPEQTVWNGMYAPYLGDQIDAVAGDAGSDGQQVIGYMGSRGHAHDLALAVPALIQLLEERPALRFETFGTIAMPEPLKRFGNRVRAHAVQKSYTGFLSHLASLGWSIGLAPLEHHEFNLCKAPTKFVEYTSCRIPVLASNVPVYSEVAGERRGVLVDEADWYVHLAWALDHPAELVRMAATAGQFCASSFSLSTLGEQVMQVIAMSTEARSTKGQDWIDDGSLAAASMVVRPRSWLSRLQQALLGSR